MPVCRIKDYSGLVAKAIMRSRRRPHYWNIFLWKDKESFLKNTKQTDENTSACHCCTSILVDPESGFLLPSPKLGEVHFIAGQWDMEVVAHELQHAITHRIRCLCPSPRQVLDEIEAEEEICYEFGEWMDNAYRWLWRKDPSENWKKTTEWSLP